MCAFYGCLAAGVVPVPIEVPLTKRVRKLLQCYIVVNSEYRFTSPSLLQCIYTCILGKFIEANKSVLKETL